VIKNALVLLLIYFVGIAVYNYSLNETNMPPLSDGDLIFQTTNVPHSFALALASGSLYLHTGIIKQSGSGTVVIHAAQTVVETPLSDWIAQGALKRFSVYRYKGLGREHTSYILEALKPYYGRMYDHYFSFDNHEIYSSELAYLAFKQANIPLGKVEKIGSLTVNNSFVTNLIEQRWQNYPACAGKDYTFDQCYEVMMSQEIITAASIADDPNVELIFTNYPF
jgi:hypothetical protein